MIQYAVIQCWFNSPTKRVEKGDFSSDNKTKSLQKKANILSRYDGYHVHHVVLAC